MGQHIATEMKGGRVHSNGLPADSPGELSQDPRSRVRELGNRVKRLEEALEHLQRTNTLGLLATGIAHDFNNLLTSILGFADLLKDEIGPRHELFPAVEVIFTAAQQGARLTAQLMHLARQGQPRRVAVGIERVIQEVAELLSRTAVGRIRMHRCLDLPGVEVLGDPTQMYQVFLNLGVNARDAMPDGGDLTFEGRLIDSPEGRLACISVRDTGLGIPEEIRGRIFEPFFTTKDPEKRFGMGLSLVHEIVSGHGGRVELSSEAGRGTTFRVFLPVVGQPDSDSREDLVESIIPGTGRVLVIEDQCAVRRTISALLRRLGYRVLSVGDVDTAVELLEQGTQVDLLIVGVDPILPGNATAFDRLRQIRPELRYLSAGSLEGEPCDTPERLHKPFTLARLSHSVAEALARD